MKMKVILISLCISVFSVSCKKDGDEKPESNFAVKIPVKYDDSKGGFNYFLTENGNTVLRPEDAKDWYTRDEFHFTGELSDYADAQKNQEIEDAIEEHFFKLAKEMAEKEPDAPQVHRGTVYYCTDIINELTICCDKDFNGITAGQPLNSHFTVTGDFIAKTDGRYVAFYRENILESDLLKEGKLVFPREFHIQLKSAPEIEDVYTFRIEIKGDGISEQKQIMPVGLK
jgi:hypothetical protein